MAGPINMDALFEANHGHLHGAARREARAKFDPYSRKEINRSLQQMIMGALHELGGQRWLVKQATQYPVAFMALAAKMLPFEKKNGDGADIKIIIETIGKDAQPVFREDAPGVINTPLKLVSRDIIDVTDFDPTQAP